MKLVATLAGAAAAMAAAVPLATAAGYNVAWTIEGTACDGTIKLGEFTAAKDACKEVACAPITEGGLTGVSTKSTCVDDYASGAKSVLEGKNPYVLVEVYNASSNCEGAFNVAVAVTADGTCIPGTNGKASYNVTWSPKTGIVWLQYADGKCAGEATTVPFKPEETLGKTCTGGNLRAWAVPPKGYKPESGSGNSTGSMTNVNATPAPTMGDGMGTSASEKPATSTGGSVPSPSPSPSSSAVSTMVGAATAATVAVVAATLA